MPEATLLVTGASGFVGRALVTRLSQEGGHRVLGSLRRDVTAMPGNVTLVRVGDLGPETDWQGALSGVDQVVHTAARAHVMRETAHDPLAEYRRVNVAGTLQLARQAAHAGVRRFVFLSSIKVHGEETRAGHPFSVDDPPAPADAYGISKREAEDVLRRLEAEEGMEVVVIRPPLVYGPGVGGNMHAMMRWLCRGLPLPLGDIRNRRSLVGLENLVDLIQICLHHPAAGGRTFLVSDGEDLSTTELLRRMARALDVTPRLVPVPQGMVEWSARLAGRGDLARRLCSSLQVDMGKTRALLGWKPPMTVDAALRLTAQHFLNIRRSP
jgi:nucleoside-diphosphate-sugar epimerase